MSQPSHIRLVCGCGYLGSRVAASWLEAGDRVLGITRGRSEELAALGIEPLVADLGDNRPLPVFPTVDTVFWAVGFGGSTSPASRRPREVQVDGFGRLLDHLLLCARGRQRPRVVLSSTTGVWGEKNGGIVDELTPANADRENGRILLESESLLHAHPLGPGVVLRFAGLYGPGRMPRLEDLRAGRPIPVDPDSWLNLIHVDDAAPVVTAISDHPSPERLYVVSDGHPVLRRDWYATLAEHSGSPPPTWSPPDRSPIPGDSISRRTRGSDKRIDSRRIWAALQAKPVYPRAIDAVPSLLASDPSAG